MNTGDTKPEPVKIQYQYVNQPDGSFRKKRVYKTNNQSKKKQKLTGSYDLVKSSRTVYHQTPAGYSRKKVYFMKKVPKTVPADKDVEPESDQDKGQETDQDKAQETDQTKGQETDQDKGQETDQTKGQETDQDKGQETDQDKGQETDQDKAQETDQTKGQGPHQTKVLAEEKKSENSLTNQQLWEQHEQETKAAKMMRRKPSDETDTDSEDDDYGEAGGVHFARD